MILTDDEKRKIMFQLKSIKEKQREIYTKNKLTFGRGLLEATEERFGEFHKKLDELFKKEKIGYSIQRKLSSDMQFGDDGYPFLNYGGHLISMQFRLHPIDVKGKENLEEGVLEKLNDLVHKEIKLKEKLMEGEQMEKKKDG